MSDITNAINTLELDYALHKEKFEEWKRANEQLSGYESYERYVEQFVEWEKSVFEQLRELRAAALQQRGGSNASPASNSNASYSRIQQPEPQLPMVNLETQLKDTLTRISQADFTVAFLAMAKKDATFLQKVFEIVHRESKGTGFTNRILKPVITLAPTTPSMYTMPLPTAMPMSASYGSSHSSMLPPPQHLSFATPPPNVMMMGMRPASSAVATAGGLLPTSQRVVPMVMTQAKPHPYYATTAAHTHFQSLQQQQQQLVTFVPSIPDGWTVDEAIHRRSKPASPARDYRKGPAVPFKDFSQT